MSKPAVSNNRLKKTGESCGRHLIRLIAGSIETFQDAFDKGSREDFLSLLPEPRYSEIWTRAAEKKLKHDVTTSDEWEHWSNVPNPIVSVFKTCYLLTGHLATDIIGLKQGLVYTSDSAVASNDRWSQTFTDRLQVVIAHPFFQGYIPWIRLAIQWAVICREDDHRTHALRALSNGGDVFLRILREVYDYQDGSHRPSTLRRLAYNLYMQNCAAGISSSKCAEPPWGVLMGYIEMLACPDEEAPPAEDLTKPTVYEVTTADLTTVIRALDQMRGLAILRESSAIIWEATKLVKSTHDVPVASDCVRAIQAQLLQEERMNRTAELDSADRVEKRRTSGPLT